LTGKAVGIFLVGIVVGGIVVGASFWYAPAIISFFQNVSSQPTDSSAEVSYTNITLRDLPIDEVNETTITFGDTDYSFQYMWGYLYVRAPFQSKDYIPKEGSTYHVFGIEIKVYKKDSDYISKFVQILVKPTVQNYMASQYYTKVTLALQKTEAVNISSGLIDKTNQYWFTYVHEGWPSYSAELRIETTSQSKEYTVLYGSGVRDLEIEVKVYKIEPRFMVIYVKPLY